MSNAIFVNQLGYNLNGKKQAFLNKDVCNCDSFIICTEDNQTVFTGKVLNPVNDELTKQNICVLDFSAFNEPGKYKIVCDKESSFAFSIGDCLYDDLYNSLLDYFYLSRCGEKIERTAWAHEPCHTGIAEVYGSTEKKEVQGGWHDAGDYGRYIVAGSKTVMDLLRAYECSKNTFNRFDILAEVRFELEWMLQMQRDDGAVYHKISCYNFCAFIMPHLEKEKIVLAPVSTSATADFAGCLAYASTFYKESDSVFADKLLAAAIKAQNYLDCHQDQYYINPSEITTGGYGDNNVSDERYFALCALFAATKKPEYYAKAKALWNCEWNESFSWGMVSAYGTEILIQNKNDIEDKGFIQTLEQGIINRADRIMNIINKSSFRVPFVKVNWGSNGFVCDEAHILLMAYDLTKKDEYYNGAKDQINYILGCNPMDICYVTGFGSNCVKHPHHRPSGAVKKTMPGMLSGGPCQGLVDAVARENLSGKAPVSCFVDHIGSYSTNEVAIYWNSPLVYVIAKLGLV
ncbi:MAG: glycoside hydrolase family 9 protein [Treponema sp.]|nr:glycoside hydrolase family 9 protein [Treponema sp.]